MIILLYLWTLAFNASELSNNSPKLSSMLDLICIEDVYSDVFRNPAFSTKINNFTLLLDGNGYYIPIESAAYPGANEWDLTRWESEYRWRAGLRSTFLIPIKKITIGVGEEEIYTGCSERESFFNSRHSAYIDIRSRIVTLFTAIPVGVFNIGYKFIPNNEIRLKEIWVHEWIYDNDYYSWTRTDTSYTSLPSEHTIGIMYDKNIICDAVWHFSPPDYSNGAIKIKKQIKPSLTLGSNIGLECYKYSYDDTSFTNFYYNYSLGASFLPNKFLTWGMDLRFCSLTDYRPDVVIGAEKKIGKLTLRGGIGIEPYPPELDNLSIGIGYEGKNFSIDAVCRTPLDDEGLRIGIRRNF